MNPILLDFNWQRFLNDRLKKEPVELQKSIDEFKQGIIINLDLEIYIY